MVLRHSKRLYFKSSRRLSTSSFVVIAISRLDDYCSTSRRPSGVMERRTRRVSEEANGGWAAERKESGLP
ncbi:hypothetical protein BKA81DRAFT_348266 [Phyllosticta paracitricarpa]